MTAAYQPEIYQFRFYVKGISPQIWRRIQVRNDSTLADLHYIIQITMNWSNFYLHQFIIRGKPYGISRLHHSLPYEAAEVCLSDLRLRLNERFFYEYNFFVWWQQEVRFEKRLPIDPRTTYPWCCEGKRAAPPEEWGGAAGFMQRQAHFSPGYMYWRLLEICEHFQEDEAPDEDDRELYRAELNSFEYWMNVERWDRRDVNRRLKWYAAGDERWTEYLEVL